MTELTTRQQHTTDGVRWSVLRAGQDRPGTTPLVLLHGGGSDSAALSFGPVLADLAATRPVIAPDLPDYGASRADDPDAPHTIEWYTAAVIGLLDALGLDRVDLGGLSLGGGIALAVALQAPQRVRGLTLFAPYGLTTTVPGGRASVWMIEHPRLNRWVSDLTFASAAGARAALRPLVRDPAALTPELVAEVRAAARARTDVRPFSRFQASEVGRAGLRTCFVDRLADVVQPTLLLAGGRDGLVPAEDCRTAAERMPACTLEVLDGAGHWLPRDRPAQLVAAVTAFLGDLDRTAQDRAAVDRTDVGPAR